MGTERKGDVPLLVKLGGRLPLGKITNVWREIRFLGTSSKKIQILQTLSIFNLPPCSWIRNKIPGGGNSAPNDSNNPPPPGIYCKPLLTVGVGVVVVVHPTAWLHEVLNTFPCHLLLSRHFIYLTASFAYKHSEFIQFKTAVQSCISLIYMWKFCKQN